jgi:hypothetical protein
VLLYVDYRYDTQSIIGYNCRFLQGADSDAREIYRLKVAVERGEEEEKEEESNRILIWGLTPLRCLSGALLCEGVMSELSMSRVTAHDRMGHRLVSRIPLSLTSLL